MTLFLYKVYISKNGHPVAHFQVLRLPLPDSVRPAKSEEIGLAEIGFAYQVDGAEDEGNARVANFFTTDCLSPFPAIAVHGTFLLKADRSRLAEDDPNYQRTLIGGLCDLLRERLIPALVRQYGPGALDYLAPRTSNSIGESDGIEAELQQRLIDAVKSTAFVRAIAGSVVAPQNLKLWDHGLGKLLEASPAGPEATRLPHPHWCNGDARTILGGLGANKLTPTEHVKAMQGWQPTSPEIACDAHDTLHQAYREICWPRYEAKEGEREKKLFVESAQRLTIWQVDTGAYRALTIPETDVIGFFEQPKVTPVLPAFIRVDWLDAAFQKSLKSRNLWDSPVSRDLRHGTLRKGEFDELLEHAVLVAVQDSSDWWETNGDDLLLALRTLHCEGKESSDIYESELRSRLADQCRVPTREAGWQLARKVYAGADWDNPWAEDFVPRSDDPRFLLAPPDRLPDGEGIVPVLRFIGVSWDPKWRRHLDGSDNYRGWPEDPASLGLPPDEFSGVDGWPDYWDKVGSMALERDNQRAGTGGVGRWPLVKAWAIEGLEDFIGGFEEIAARVRALRDLWEAEAHRSRRTIVVGRRGPLGKKIGKFESEPLGGFVAWQFNNSRLFSVQRSPFFPNGKAALCDLLIGSPSHEAWLKWLPRLSLTRCDPRETRDLEKFALEFGAKASVSDYSLEQWRGWLSRLADWTFEEPPVKELRGLLHALSRLKAQPHDWGRDTRLPCVAADDTLVCCRLSELTVLDETRFEGFRSALLTAGHRLLLASVVDGRRLLEMLGCEARAVSALVQLDVAEHRPCPQAQERLTWCDRVRPLVLAWFDHAGELKAAERLRDGWPQEMRAHRPLQVNVALTAGDTLGCLEQPFLWEDDVLHVDAGEATRLWDHVAEGFKQRSKLDKPVEDGVVRLLQAVEAEESPEAGREFLRIKGIAPEELQRWEQEILPEPEPLPNQPTLPQIVGAPDLEPCGDAITDTPVVAHLPKAPSPSPRDPDDQRPMMPSETPREPRQQPISGSPISPGSPMQTQGAAPTADPETGPTPEPTPVPPDVPQTPPPSRPRGHDHGVGFFVQAFDSLPNPIFGHGSSG